ncbi:MAG: division/cell wall cluster transcriptional repressor MraZ [Bacteroidetes bacterium]|nr:MAG: division/cell wall cluster transcriptional repressor MraZ [Bacteroidota bacterium]
MVNIIGSYECKVDAKGRLALPSGLKKQLLEVVNEGFVLKRSVFHNCLELYPMSEWNAEIAGVNKLNRFVKKNNDFIRMFMAGVKMLEMDASGRIQISKDLINYSGIKKEVVLSSAVNRIEIWDKESYEKVVNNPEVDFAELAEEVMGNIDLQEEK